MKKFHQVFLLRSIYLSISTHIFVFIYKAYIGKESACHAGNQGLIPGLGSSSGEGNGNPIQYSRLENSMDKEAGQATVCDMIEQLTHTHILGVVLNSFQIENVG